MIETVIIALALAGGSFSGGWYVGDSRCESKHEEIQQRITETRQAAIEAASSEIAKIKIEQTVVNNEIQREIVEKPVYRDCKHTAESWKAITGAFK